MTEPANGNTIIYRLAELERRGERLSDRLHTAEGLAGEHEEQINGKRGLQVAVDQLADEVKALRRTISTVGIGIILAAVTFALSVLQQ
ncbi:MAG: hypothetical protein Q8O56_06150 [Solirubrobacteraceae bacterium]|nr:hypothetical protein [Solirubrobacteraceae bacterium]